MIHMSSQRAHANTRPKRNVGKRHEARRVQDPQTRLHFCRIISDVFGVPYQISAEVYGDRSFWEGSYIAWVGYRNGKPIVTVATDSSSGVIGVYSVATVPKHRGKGFGEAITRHGVEQAARSTGLQRSILQSTPAGLTLYKQMGYQRLGLFSVFIST